MDVPLRCECGKLRGTATRLSRSAGTRIVCYCDDCQAFARFLGRPDITDRWGGTDIFQMAPSRVRIEHDEDALRCVRLSDKGMYRWYCGHCKTPVGNTVGPRVPFVGLIHSFMDHAASGASRDDFLGKPVGYVQTRFAIGAPPHGGPISTVRATVRSLMKLTKWWVTGAGVPSPFFDEKTGAPRITPRVLSSDERRAL